MPLYNLVRVHCSTRGTGSLTLGEAVEGWLDFTDVADGEVTYTIRNADQTEIGHGTYDSSTGTLTRTTILKSTNSDAAIDIDDDCEVALTISAEDLDPSNFDFTQSGTGAVVRTLSSKLQDIVSVDDFGTIGGGVTDDRAAIQAAIDAVAAAGGGIVYLGRGETYRVVINTGVTDLGLIIKSGVTLHLNDGTLNLECTGNVYGVRLQSSSHITGPGTVAVSVSSGLLSYQNIWHAPITLGDAYGNAGTVGNVSSYSTASNWSVRNLTLTSVRDDTGVGDPGGGLIKGYGGVCYGLIEDIIIPSHTKIAIGIGFDWSFVGTLSSGDIAGSRTNFDAGTAYSIHPHDITIRRISIGSLSVARTATFGSHGIRLSGVYNIRCENITINQSTYAGIFHTAGDLGFEFAPTSVKYLRHRGMVFKDILIENAVKGIGFYSDTFADNIEVAVTGAAYSSLLPTVGYTDMVVENVVTQGDASATAIQGFHVQTQFGGTFRNCSARFHSNGFLIESNCDQLKIIGGIYDSNWVRGIFLNPGTGTSDIQIEGAWCYSNGFGGGASDAGIEITNTARPTVKNCVFGINGESYQDYGLRLTSSVTEAIIEDNYCIDVAGASPAYSIGSSNDYGILSKFAGNQADSSISPVHGGADILPYTYIIDTDGNRITVCRARRSALTADITPMAGTWKAGTVIEYTNPVANGPTCTICTTSGSPGTWQQFGAGNVTASAAITDNRIVRGDGGGKGIQETGISADDSNNVSGIADLRLTTINLGHDTDTTFSRVSAGVAAIEGNNILTANNVGSIVQAYSAILLSWAGVTRAAGFDTFAATPSSANLRSLVTDETGSGALVFATSPTLVTPNLGTPSAVTLTNGTGLPVAGIAASTVTALGVGTLELGHASDTTLSRLSAGVVAVEGVALVKSTQARELLTAARTYYVRTDGSDSNTGLTNNAGGAFLTIQKAINVVSGSIDMAAYQVTIQVGAGTYTGAINFLSWSGNLPPILVGDETTPGNVIITTTSADAVTNDGAHPWHIRGMRLQTISSGRAMYCANGGGIYFQKIDFGTTAGNHMHCIGPSSISATGDYSISGSPGGDGIHMISADSGYINTTNITVTLTGTPAWSSNGFAHASRIGEIRASGNTYSGAATGTRYLANNNAVIYTAGASATYFPGDAAGSTATGGIYA